jgi:hypothetical protein
MERAIIEGVLFFALFAGVIWFVIGRMKKDGAWPPKL